MRCFWNCYFSLSWHSCYSTFLFLELLKIVGLLFCIIWYRFVFLGWCDVPQTVDKSIIQFLTEQKSFGLYALMRLNENFHDDLLGEAVSLLTENNICVAGVGSKTFSWIRNYLFRIRSSKNEEQINKNFISNF